MPIASPAPAAAARPRAPVTKSRKVALTTSRRLLGRSLQLEVDRAHAARGVDHQRDRDALALDAGGLDAPLRPGERRAPRGRARERAATAGRWCSRSASERRQLPSSPLIGKPIASGRPGAPQHPRAAAAPAAGAAAPAGRRTSSAPAAGALFDGTTHRRSSGSRARVVGLPPNRGKMRSVDKAVRAAPARYNGRAASRGEAGRCDQRRGWW